MLDVSGDESGYLAAGGAVRLHQQPEFRGATGARGTDPSGESDDGSGGGD